MPRRLPPSLARGKDTKVGDRVAHKMRLTHNTCETTVTQQNSGSCSRRRCQRIDALTTVRGKDVSSGWAHRGLLALSGTYPNKCRVANFEPDVDHKHTSRENLIPIRDEVSPKALRSLREGKIGSSSWVPTRRMHRAEIPGKTPVWEIASQMCFNSQTTIPTADMLFALRLL